MVHRCIVRGEADSSGSRSGSRCAAKERDDLCSGPLSPPPLTVEEHLGRAQDAHADLVRYQWQLACLCCAGGREASAAQTFGTLQLEMLRVLCQSVADDPSFSTDAATTQGSEPRGGSEPERPLQAALAALLHPAQRFLVRAAHPLTDPQSRLGCFGIRPSSKDHFLSRRAKP
jgi:hypothetical protein